MARVGARAVRALAIFGVPHITDSFAVFISDFVKIRAIKTTFGNRLSIKAITSYDVMISTSLITMHFASFM